MKIFLAVLGIVALLVVLAIAGRVALVLISNKPAATVTSTVTLEPNSVLCSLVLQNSDRPMTVTSIHLARVDAEAAGFGPPPGFQLKPMQDESDPEFAKKWNLENVQYIGALELAPGQPSNLRFPIASAPSKPLQLSGQIEGKWGIGGTMSFFRIDVPTGGASTP